MPRVHSQKARKDYPDVGVVKGDIYYKWTTRPGGRGKGILHRSATYPKPWLLTSSPFLQAQYLLEDQIGTLVLEEGVDLAAARDEWVSEIQSLGEEQEEKLSNMPESLQYSPSGETLQERIDGCEAWAQELEGVDLDEGEDDEEDAAEGRLEELQNCMYPG